MCLLACYFVLKSEKGIIFSIQVSQILHHLYCSNVSMANVYSDQMSEAVSNALAASCRKDKTIHFCSFSFWKEKAVAASVLVASRSLFCSADASPYCESCIKLVSPHPTYSTGTDGKIIIIHFSGQKHRNKWKVQHKIFLKHRHKIIKTEAEIIIAASRIIINQRHDKTRKYNQHFQP